MTAQLSLFGAVPEPHGTLQNKELGRNQARSVPDNRPAQNTDLADIGSSVKFLTLEPNRPVQNAGLCEGNESPANPKSERPMIPRFQEAGTDAKNRNDSAVPETSLLRRGMTPNLAPLGPHGSSAALRSAARGQNHVVGGRAEPVASRSGTGLDTDTGRASKQGGSRPAPTLRPYQLAAIDALWTRYREGHRRELIVLPTGCGKTLIFSHFVLQLLAFLASINARALIVAHRSELLEQAIEKLAQVGIRAALDQADSKPSLSATVVVGSVQTLKGARLERYAPDHFAIVIVDEAHRAAATSYENILERFADAFQLGVTATPKRLDGKALGDVFTNVAYAYELRQAIRDTWLVPIKAKRITVRGLDLSRVKTRGGDLDQSELAKLLTAEEALHAMVSPLMEQTRGLKTLVFAVDVPHAKAIAEVINRHEPGAAMALDGSASTAERKAVLGLFRKGAIRYLVNCALFTEGFDEPSIQCVAMMRPTASWALYTQMLGRVTRLLGLTLEESIANGKAFGLVLDFVGNTGKHRLIGPADALAGGVLTEEQRALVEKKLDAPGQLDIESVLAAVDDELEQQRTKVALVALAHYRTKEVDPFIGDFMKPIDPDSPRAKEPATEKQIAVLCGDPPKGWGMSKPPPGLTLGEASAMIDACKARHDAGLCSMPQMRLLEKFGLDCRTMTKARASELFTKGKKHGFKPYTFLFEPEKRRRSA